MGVLPVPADWSKDLWTKFGDRFNRIESRLDALETGRTFVARYVQADIQGSNGFFVAPYGEALFQLVDVPKGYSRCQVTLGCSAGQSMTGATAGSVGIQAVVDNTYKSAPLVSGVTGAQTVSVMTSYTVVLTDLTPGTPIRLGAWVNNLGTLVPASASVSLSASLLFLR